MKLQPVIGLETHVQLNTKTKLFCACSNAADDNHPNSAICSVCLGEPGVLPVPNEDAVKSAILLGLALNGEIAEISKFDRKNYFYPDLPKAYQISQYDKPVMENGHLDVHAPGEDAPTRIGIERLHLEEDAAKNIHGENGRSFVDFNRGGTPLCEIVTRPHFHNAAEARAYVMELRTIVRTLGVSDGDMEKGQLRCDVNISMRRIQDDGTPEAELHPKTEIKNVNSFKAIERAIEYEIKRQTKLWEAGNPPSITVTRGWNDAKQQTTEQRAKEGEADYRYFPEPDIPPMNLVDMEKDIAARMPELPAAKRRRYIDEYNFRPQDAYQLVEYPALATFAEHAISELDAWLQAQPDISPDDAPAERRKLMKLLSSWLLNKLPGLLSERKGSIETMKVNAENFAELIKMIAGGDVTAANALKILDAMLESGGDPSHIMEDMGAKRVDDTDALESVLDTVFEANPDEFERLKNGEKKLIQFMVGQVMKETRGNADAATVIRILSDRLGF
jgi:aspartyl-tRNA(Asn)/glutamyl-tRNA(Gln) amidotransferase subunit B